MQKIMFTKHLEGLDIPQIIGAIKSVGIDGVDLCVRSGYPVNPENADIALPEAAKQFASHGLSIPLVTTPGDFLDPTCNSAPPKILRGVSYYRTSSLDTPAGRWMQNRLGPTGSLCLGSFSLPQNASKHNGMKVFMIFGA